MKKKLNEIKKISFIIKENITETFLKECFKKGIALQGVISDPLLGGTKRTWQTVVCTKHPLYWDDYCPTCNNNPIPNAKDLQESTQFIMYAIPYF